MCVYVYICICMIYTHVDKSIQICAHARLFIQSS